MAYDRKEWALHNLCQALAANATLVGIVWGWGLDPAEPMHCNVLYVDLPTGQVSFHTGRRLNGPAYHGAWDGVRHAGADRIIRWIVAMASSQTAAA